MIAAIVAAGYLPMIPFIARLMYRNLEWHHYNSDQENKTLSFLWALVWPLTGLFLIAQVAMEQPGRSERRAARQERAKQQIREKAASLSRAEAELRDITRELKQMGINF